MSTESTQAAALASVGVQRLVGPISPELARYFPKLCKPRKQHRCRLCGTKIGIAEPCCSWSLVEPGDGWETYYAHPECYQVTLDAKWDDGDWECHSPGDDFIRPNDKAQMRLNEERKNNE